ncbi:cation diffusion facilitator family transporter [Ferrimonas lipolytica]|uniref:Cation-efflux pump FieF n=1 Tax=Ferrimonas lipolytica TaxID=2724191 RepID=A0A6H1UG88_9GAMM|nr:cation diffusion facilitator family transporter [Ferrimonas lipolytica]QIZ78117.1 cation diffusion facilitator family transporter [Ferrimonas lipolytica]
MARATPEQYESWIKLATRASIAVATLLIITKLMAWLMSGSASLLGSLTDSLMDAAASLINFYALRVALRPADDHHRWGHGKAEPLATLVQAGFILGSALLLLFAGTERLISPVPPSATGWGVGVSIFAIVATLALLTIQKKAVAATGSTAIAADALHYRSDLLMNVAVIIALIMAAYGFWWVDGAAAVGIAFYIGFGAWGLGKEAVNLLLDREADAEVQQQVQALILADDNVLGLHDFRTRMAGNTLFVQMHIDLDSNLSLLKAHDIAHAVEDRIQSQFPGADVIVHQDPHTVEA